MMKFLILIPLFIINLVSLGQSVAINSGGFAADPSAVLDITSNNRGVLVPRLTKPNRNAILTPATGLLVYINAPDTTGFSYFNGTQWVWILSGATNDTTAWKTTGNTTTDNHFIGTLNNKALKFRVNNVPSGIIDSTNQSTAFGFRTLRFNTAVSNTAFGHNALDSVISGASNNAFGNKALISNTLGSNNIAIGDNSLSNNKDGNNNIAIGTQAAEKNNGNYNTAIGVGALKKYAASSDGFNVIIGDSAASNLGAGMYNTAIGSYALKDHVTGNRNTAIGNFALTSGTAGDNNTAVGDYALLNTSGSGNTAIGRGAGALNGTGSFNTLIGFNSLTTGTITNATAIGNKSYATQSNTVILGSINGVNTATASTLVGIGTTTPNSSLHIDGNLAIGVSMGLIGGTISTPVSLAGTKTYIGCSPVDNTNNFYELPNPSTCIGRIYYIRNNSSTYFSNIVTAGGLIFGGSSATAAGGNTYTLNPTTAAKTVICISDGLNWTIGQIN